MRELKNITHNQITSFVILYHIIKAKKIEKEKIKNKSSFSPFCSYALE